MESEWLGLMCWSTFLIAGMIFALVAVAWGWEFAKRFFGNVEVEINLSPKEKDYSGKEWKR